MKDRFFESALSAAVKSDEAFAAEFKKKGAYANVHEYYRDGYGYFGSPLIHEIIRTVSDERLPALLGVLIKEGVNLETIDMLEQTPLSVAARICKKDAVHFLIHHKAIINTRKELPLCNVMCTHTSSNEILDIVKILLKHGADINKQDEFSKSPLMKAAQYRHAKVIEYLLSQGADLFLQYIYAGEMQYKTALGIAYEEYISARRCFKENDAYTQNAKKCLDLLVQATADYLYQQGLKENNEELFISHSIKKLAGHFKDIYIESNNNAVTKLLEETIKPAVLARIRREKEHAFCMGSKLSKSQRAQHDSVPPVHRFFQKDGRKDLTREIFSYLNFLTQRSARPR